jgi:SHS2 domain-containing protein
MYSWIEHESELELLIEDESPEAVFTEALAGVGELLADARGGAAVTHEVSARAADLPTLLAAWVNELVNLAERDGFVPERVIQIELGDTSIKATVGGQRSLPQGLIKAVTYDRLEMTEVDGEWQARVVLDVG